MTKPFARNGLAALPVDERRSLADWRAHVLIVDDEPNFRFATGIALKRAGYRITEAEDAETALRLVTRPWLAPCGLEEPATIGGAASVCPFDLLLVDIQMPGMSGAELIEEVRRRNIAVPVFAISAFADERLAGELKTKGGVELLPKPFEPGELVERIRLSLLARVNGRDTR